MKDTSNAYIQAMERRKGGRYLSSKRDSETRRKGIVHGEGRSLISEVAAVLGCN